MKDDFVGFPRFAFKVHVVLTRLGVRRLGHDRGDSFRGPERGLQRLPIPDYYGFGRRVFT